jgi:hypothetical protein
MAEYWVTPTTYWVSTSTETTTGSTYSAAYWKKIAEDYAAFTSEYKSWGAKPKSDQRPDAPMKEVE